MNDVIKRNKHQGKVEVIGKKLYAVRKFVAPGDRILPWPQYRAAWNCLCQAVPQYVIAILTK